MKIQKIKAVPCSLLSQYTGAMKYPVQKLILEQNTPESIIERVLPFVNEQRRARIDAVIQHRLQSIQLAIECPADINNVFAAMRTAETLGIGHVHIITPEGTARHAHTVSRGAYFWMDTHFHNSLADFVTYAKTNQLTIAGGIVDAPIGLPEVSIDTPLCILLGNEQRGLTDAAKAVCDLKYTIPMVGMSESMNLSVSAAISLYDTTQRKRMQLAGQSDLTSAENLRLEAKYLLNSIAPRLAAGLFQ
jgi:tRNA (guanosine-2'-O-)-methyltransferase